MVLGWVVEGGDGGFDEQGDAGGEDGIQRAVKPVGLKVVNFTFGLLFAAADFQPQQNSEGNGCDEYPVDHDLPPQSGCIS